MGRQSSIMPFLVCIYIYMYIRIATTLLVAALTQLFWILGQTLLVSTTLYSRLVQRPWCS